MSVGGFGAPGAPHRLKRGTGSLSALSPLADRAYHGSVVGLIGATPV